MLLKNKKFKCPCCGYFTLEICPPGTFEICPVCFWEDDNIQFEDPEYEGGANEMSLNIARKNFLKFGAISEKFKNMVRSPNKDEFA